MGTSGALFGLILGLAGLVMSFFTGWAAVIALPLTIIALVLTVSGRKALVAAKQPTGIATIGITIGIIALVFSTISFFTCGLCQICSNAAKNSGSDVLDFIQGLTD